ncbi:MAG: glycosyltransferase [Halioglobus sp.]
MIVSIETPVFKGKWLRPCIDSVLGQTSPDWKFSLVWDGGDEESRRILEELQQRNHPNVTVHFSENRGIARARQYLSAHSEGDFILPLDDDDVLPFHAVERFLEVAKDKPWSSVIRAKRLFIDEQGKTVDLEPWFPFERRHYQRGMVTDLFNHSQPYLIRRLAYDRTSGWEGFEDFMFAGEDCDIYLKLEENGSIELLDEMLYYYRLNPDRASDTLTPEGAFEMWRRLADKTIARIGLPLRRVNDTQPFQYEQLSTPIPTLDMVDFVIVGDAQDPTGAQPNKMATVLKSCGVADDAVHMACQDEQPLGRRVRSVQLTTRSFVCIVDCALTITDRQSVEKLLKLMHERQSDLVAPRIDSGSGVVLCADPSFTTEKRPAQTGEGLQDEGQYNYCKNASWLTGNLMLVRREVLNAVGGFDDNYEHDMMAIVDFCLKARQRDFKCEYLGSISFSRQKAESELNIEVDLCRLHEKWIDYPIMFDVVDETH